MDSAQVTHYHSKTFYYATLFFPPEVRDDVFTLYAYVRVADDYVDSIPSQSDAFYTYWQQTRDAFCGGRTGNRLVDTFCAMAHRRSIPLDWVEAFFRSLEMDMGKKRYATFADLEEFIYGVADVIGLMMTRIMTLPDASHMTARLFGKSMQLVNILRDVAEDLTMGRVYIPQEDMRRFGVINLPPQGEAEEGRFMDIMRFEIDRYRDIQREAWEGLAYIPRRLQLPIRVVFRLYAWTADQINYNPMIVFDHKVKPGMGRIGWSIAHELARR